MVSVPALPPQAARGPRLSGAPRIPPGLPRAGPGRARPLPAWRSLPGSGAWVLGRRGGPAPRGASSPPRPGLLRGPPSPRPLRRSFAPCCILFHFSPSCHRSSPGIAFWLLEVTGAPCPLSLAVSCFLSGRVEC